MDNNSVKRNIEGIRKELGLSQQSMAERLGMTRNAYRGIEKGETRIISDYIFKLSELSDKSVEEIYLGYQPYADYSVALQDEHTRLNAQFEAKKFELEGRIKDLEAENRLLSTSLKYAENQVELLTSINKMLEKNQGQ